VSTGTEQRKEQVRRAETIGNRGVKELQMRASGATSLGSVASGDATEPGWSVYD